MDTKACISQLTQFREELYQKFNHRADTLMELVDAIASNPQVRSVVEYTLTPCFRRSYSTLFKAIAEMSWEQRALPQLLAAHLPRPVQRSFWLLGVDLSSQPRHYARTLPDRGMVYEPTLVKSNKPVTIGHQYSSVALLPEAETGISGSWVIPLLTRRVHTQEDKEMVGAGQIDSLLQDPDLPFRQELCVEVGDSSYSKPVYLHAHRQHSQLVTLARVRSNRRFYRQYVPTGNELPRSRADEVSNRISFIFRCRASGYQTTVDRMKKGLATPAGMGQLFLCRRRAAGSQRMKRPPSLKSVGAASGTE